MMTKSDHENELLLQKSDSKSISDSQEDRWSNCVVTNIIICITYFSFAGGIITSQLTNANVLQINVLQYSLISVVIFALKCFFNYPLDIKAQHCGKLLACVVLHLVNGMAYYASATFMPLGNFNGLHAAFATVLATGYDFYWKRINKVSVISAVCAIIGIILLTQPWATKDEIKLLVSPCEYLENTSQPLIQTIINGSNPYQQQNAKDVLKTWFNKYSDIISFLLITFISVTAVTKGVLIRQIFTEYPVTTILFWHVTIEGFASLIMNIFWSAFSNSPFLDVPSGSLCKLFTVLFLVFTAFGTVFSFLGYKRTFVSTTEVTDITFTVFLYLCQRTFLKQFHPGHGNVVEVIGIVTIACSVPVIRLFSFIFDKGQRQLK